MFDIPCAIRNGACFLYIDLDNINPVYFIVSVLLHSPHSSHVNVVILNCFVYYIHSSRKHEKFFVLSFDPSFNQFSNVPELIFRS